MRICIDDIYYEVKAGKNLLESCIGLGLDLPYFCYHPALGSVGACRQCAVKKYANAGDKKGKIVMACMEPVTDDMIISINDPEAKQFRAGIIEGLMTNHPHDCPVCDEGGECHLQDMTVMTGHNYRRFDFRKRTYISQNLGPFIHHEMNRCIQCYRCVRFYRDYAGGKDLNVFGSANNLYFGRKEDGILESEFSGNLVEVCPTGVFTDKTLKNHYTRKWDLSNGPSVCVHCSLGCNTLVGERYGQIRRVMNRYHEDINGYFLCDRGRFGYEFVNHPSRLKNILVNNSSPAFGRPEDLQELLASAKKSSSKGLIVGIGSPRASLESNFALKALVGKQNFYSGISRKEHRLMKRALNMLNRPNIKAISLKEIEKCDAALILGEDITQTAPVMALSLRQMVRTKSIKLAESAGIPSWNDSPMRELGQDEKSPLYVAHPYSTRLDEVAKVCFNNSPAEIARLGFAIASAIDTSAPQVSELDQATADLARRIADDLMAAENPLLISGITGADDQLFDALNNIISALSLQKKQPSLAIVFPESNSAGVMMLDAGDMQDVVDRVTKEKAAVLIILENDIYRRIASADAEKLLASAEKVIVIDHLMHPAVQKAQIVLPAAVWTESTGTLVNNELRAQRYFPSLPISAPVSESWQWIMEIMNYSGNKEYNWFRFDDVVHSMIQQHPVFSELVDIPDARFRINNEKIARQTMRFSGRTAMTANIAVSEPKPPEDYNSPLKFSMEGYKGTPPASLIPFYWAPGWNSPQAANKYLNEPDGAIKSGKPGIKLSKYNADQEDRFINIIPQPVNTGANELLLIPVPVIFGSEELSSRAEAISELIPAQFVLINEREAEKRSLKNGDPVNLDIAGKILKINLRTDDRIADGIAGLSIIQPGLEYLEFPVAGKLTGL